MEEEDRAKQVEPLALTNQVGNATSAAIFLSNAMDIEELR